MVFRSVGARSALLTIMGSLALPPAAPFQKGDAALQLPVQWLMYVQDRLTHKLAIPVLSARIDVRHAPLLANDQPAR